MASTPSSLAHEPGMRSPAFSETSQVSTPLSASDFADAYGQDWRTSVHAHSDERVRLSHFREPATDDDKAVAALGLGLDRRQIETPSPTPAEYFEASSAPMADGIYSVHEALPGVLKSAGVASEEADEAGGVSRRASEATVGPGRGVRGEDREGEVAEAGPPLIPQEPVTPKGPVSGGAQVQSDAKARAIAFVADLKKAREERERAAAAAGQQLDEHQQDQEPAPEPHSPVERAPTPTQDSSRSHSQNPPVPPHDPPTQTPTRATTPTPGPGPGPGHAPRLPSSSSTQSGLSAAPPAPPAINLSRRRPLPPSLQIAADLRQCRTPGERALVYARKINALRREDSGLAQWLGLVRGAHAGAGQGGPSPSSPRQSASSRREGSFPMRGGEGASRATEIVAGPANPNFQPVNVPYPGALHHSSSSASHKPASAIKPGFFSGLGRKASSHRSHAGRTPPLLSSAGGGGNGSFPSIGSPLGASTSNISISRPIGGPRPPRNSFDIVPLPSSAESSPQLGNGSGGSPRLPAVPYAGSGLGQGSVGGGGGGVVTPGKLSAMRDMLPGDADGEALADALVRAGGDEVAAIGIYLSGRQG